MAVCPVPWLRAPTTPDDITPRWRSTGVLEAAPTTALVLPVRDLRVMYGLNPEHYGWFAQHQLPHAHEFFVPMAALTSYGGDRDPALQALVARVSTTHHFFQETA